MKKKDLQTLKEKSIQELNQMVNDLKLEALKTKIEIKKGKIKNVHAYLEIRKKIAKILTLINEKNSYLEIEK